MVFPHCPCDSRKEGHVVASVGTGSFKLLACRKDGVLEVNLEAIFTAVITVVILGDLTM